MNRLPLDLSRAFRYVAAATLLAVAVGVFQQGSLAGGLLLGFAVALGTAVGLLLFEVISWKWNV